jgi:hypothetical protein
LEIVVAARHAGDRIEQDHDIFFEFHEAFGAFRDGLADLHVPGDLFIEGRTVDFAVQIATQISHLLGAFIHQ